MTELTELQKNIAAYKKMEKELLENSAGKVALFSNGEFIDVFNDFLDAHKIGTEKYGEGHFSVKEVTSKPVGLGYMGIVGKPVSISAAH